MMCTGLFLCVSFAYLSVWYVLFFYLLCSIGFACIQSGIPYYLARTLSAGKFGTAIGQQQLVQFFGGAFGVTCIGLVLDWKGIVHVNPLWKGTALVYSNAFCLLLTAGAAGVLIGILSRLQRHHNSKTYYSPPDSLAAKAHDTQMNQE
nr:hypothetical protein [Aneurinibacillus terranovensis]